MGISGSDVAGTQARFGVMRFGDFRFGAYWPNLIVNVNGVDLASWVRLETLEVLHRLNGEPNEARFTIRRDVDFTEGMPVRIALGADGAGTRLLIGTIITLTNLQDEKDHQAWCAVVVRDKTWFLDRRLLTARYTSEPADVIVKDINGTLLGGLFTTNHVQADLTSIDVFTLTNERPSTAFTRLATQADADWYIDESDDLHFFTVEGGIPDPPELNSTNPYFWDFRPTIDLQQVRTEAIVEGKRTRCPIAIPLGHDLMGGTTTIPIEDSSIFPEPDLIGRPVRVGSNVISYNGTDNWHLAAGAVQGTNVRAATAVGATSLPVDDVSWQTPGGRAAQWVRVGEQWIFFNGVTAGGTPTLNNVPASGFGSIAVAIEAGTPVTVVGTLKGIPSSGAGSFTYAEPANADVVIRQNYLDSAAAAALAAKEGGDGVHQMLVQDGRLDTLGAAQRAQAEVESGLNAAVTSIAYKTRDTRTRIGRTVSVVGVAGVTGTFLIQHVRFTEFDRRAEINSRSVKTFPVREVVALPVKLGSALDVLRGVEDAY